MPGKIRLKGLTQALGGVLLVALAGAPVASAASQPPAAGAGLDQVALATGGATVATAILLWVCMSHRSGRIKWLGRLAAFAEKETGGARRASLPRAMLGLSLLTPGFRLYLGISPHLDNRPRPRPPPH